jgi:signal transduction histidine kinase
MTHSSDILLVEDDPSHRALIEGVLDPHLFRVKGFGTIREARGFLSSSPQQKFDVIVSDLHLPEVLPDAVVKTLRTLVPTSPLIVLTSSRSVNEAVSAMRAGAQDYLVKDFDGDFGDLLYLTLRRVIAQNKAEEERRRLEYEMTVLQGAVENGQDGFAIIDSSLRVLYSNVGFDNFLNDRQEDESGRMLQALQERGSRFISQLRQVVTTMPLGGVWHTEIEGKGPENLWLALSVSSVSGEASGDRYVLWVRDITEVKRRQRVQRAVVSTTTHDLRSPLSTVVLSARLLKDRLAGTGDSTVQELVERMTSSVERAKKIVDQFLSRQHLEEGVMVLIPELTPIVEVVKTLVGEEQLKEGSARISLHLKGIQEDLLWKVDKVGFGRIVENLLANALKFSSHDSEVTVTLELRDTCFVFKVQDVGGGIPAHLVPSIFERGVRLPEHRSVGGSGLGLWIVRSIVDGHGGSVDIQSNLRKGTEVSVFFPAEPPVDEYGNIRLAERQLDPSGE